MQVSFNGQEIVPVVYLNEAERVPAYTFSRTTEDVAVY